MWTIPINLLSRSAEDSETGEESNLSMPIVTVIIKLNKGKEHTLERKL